MPALRRKFLEMLVRQGEEAAAQVKEESQASARTEQDYEETAAAMAEKKELPEDKWAQQELRPTQG